MSCCSGGLANLGSQSTPVIGSTATYEEESNVVRITWNIKHDISSRINKFITDLELAEKKSEILAGIFCLFSKRLEVIVHPSVFKELNNLHCSLHFGERIIRGLSFISDVLKYGRGDFLEYKVNNKPLIEPQPNAQKTVISCCKPEKKTQNAETSEAAVEQKEETKSDDKKAEDKKKIDYFATAGRMALAVSHLFSSIDMLKYLKLMESSRFNSILKYKKLVNVAGFTCLLFSAYLGRKEDSQSTSKLRIAGTGVFLDLLSKLKKQSYMKEYASLISDLSKVVSIGHACLVHSFNSPSGKKLLTEMSKEKALELQSQIANLHLSADSA